MGQHWSRKRLHKKSSNPKTWVGETDGSLEATPLNFVSQYSPSDDQPVHVESKNPPLVLDCLKDPTTPATKETTAHQEPSSSSSSSAERSLARTGSHKVDNLGIDRHALHPWPDLLAYKAVTASNGARAVLWLQVSSRYQSIYSSEHPQYGPLCALDQIKPKTKYCAGCVTVIGIQFIGSLDVIKQGVRLCIHDRKFVYRLGDTYREPDVGKAGINGCCQGIHFYPDLDSAMTYLSQPSRTFVITDKLEAPARKLEAHTGKLKAPSKKLESPAGQLEATALTTSTDYPLEEKILDSIADGRQVFVAAPAEALSSHVLPLKLVTSDLRENAWNRSHLAPSTFSEAVWILDDPFFTNLKNEGDDPSSNHPSHISPKLRRRIRHN